MGGRGRSGKEGVLEFGRERKNCDVNKLVKAAMLGALPQFYAGLFLSAAARGQREEEEKRGREEEEREEEEEGWEENAKARVWERRVLELGHKRHSCDISKLVKASMLGVILQLYAGFFEYSAAQ